MRLRDASAISSTAAAVSARSVSSLGVAGSSERRLCIWWHAGTSLRSTWKAEPGAEAATPETAARRCSPSFLSHARDAGQQTYSDESSQVGRMCSLGEDQRGSCGR